MGRCRRICFPGAFYHCINRGNRREQIYRDNSDYQQMLEGLANISSRYKVRIHSYCLMPNHFHLLVEQQDLSVSLAMRSLTTCYARYFNRKYHKVGHVFQGRFRGILCDKQSYLLELVRYIHLNPVRARLIQLPQEWEWSSLSAYLGKSKNEWLYQKDVMEIFGRQPRHRLQEFLAQAPDLTPGQIYPSTCTADHGKQGFHQPGEQRRRTQTQAATSILRAKVVIVKIGGAIGRGRWDDVSGVPSKSQRRPAANGSSGTLCTCGSADHVLSCHRSCSFFGSTSKCSDQDE
jgi:REP element-mobilizing transposase RayT